MRTRKPRMMRGRREGVWVDVEGRGALVLQCCNSAVL